MSIWFGQPTVEALVASGQQTMVEHLGIVCVEVGPDFLRGTMPVDARTRQPAGILHGGASVTLAETLGSLAGNLVVNPATHLCVGLEINANHVRSCADGQVEGVTRPLHLGKSTQIWETRITQGDKLVCISRLTLAVLARKG